MKRAKEPGMKDVARNDQLEMARRGRKRKKVFV